MQQTDYIMAQILCVMNSANIVTQSQSESHDKPKKNHISKFEDYKYESQKLNFCDFFIQKNLFRYKIFSFEKSKKCTFLKNSIFSKKTGLKDSKQGLCTHI